ncbi:hypothetical protein ABZ845_04440 [Streptomyces sp. NPDC047022]|uniref:hypothetical protein n=1 Tax=Streptomyces sp. NPDC047022 TaxID=3155737 RepID=UPI0033C59B45
MRDRIDGIVRRGILPVAVALVLSAGAASSGGGDGDGGDGGSHKGSAKAYPGRGDGRIDPRTATALVAVEKATAEAGSARIESTTAMGGMLAVRTDGALSWSGPSIGTLRFTWTGGRLAETMRALNDTSMEARLLPDAYYTRVGAAFARRLNGRHWIKYAYDDLAPLSGGSRAYLPGRLRNASPIQPVRLLLAAGDTHRVGTERVSGRSTTHYSGTVTTASLTGADTAGLKAQLEQAEVGKETVDIWVDDHNLLVKKTEQGELASGRMSATACYRAYGVKVSATEPPAADTADFKELMSTQW